MRNQRKFDFVRFARENGLPTRTEREGWLQTNCPFCGDDDYHMGFNLAGSYFNCFRCGGMSVGHVLAKMFPGNFKQLLGQYSEKQGAPIQVVHARPVVATKRSSLKMPTNTPLATIHRKYLVSRNYDPDELEDVWGLRATTHVGEYAFRILAPISFDGKVVTYQTRDVTGKSPSPYLAANKRDELRDIKDCLYGYDEAVAAKKTFVVVFEGIPSVWRYGVGSVATFGVTYTPKQLELLLRWETIVVMFDRDDAGRKAARKLVDELLIMGKRAFNGFTEDAKAVDELDQVEADKLREELEQLFGPSVNTKH